MYLSGEVLQTDGKFFRISKLPSNYWLKFMGFFYQNCSFSDEIIKNRKKIDFFKTDLMVFVFIFTNT